MAIEYALIAALIAVVIISALLSVNSSLSRGYNSLANAVSDANK